MCFSCFVEFGRDNFALIFFNICIYIFEINILGKAIDPLSVLCK